MIAKIQTGTPNTSVDNFETVKEYSVDSTREIIRAEVTMDGLTVALIANNKALSVSFDGGENFNVIKMAANGSTKAGQRFGVMKAVRDEMQKNIDTGAATVSCTRVLRLLDAIKNNDMAAVQGNS